MSKITDEYILELEALLKNANFARDTSQARIRELEALLMDRPWPDCAQSKMIEWYKRIDAALGTTMVTAPGKD